MKRLLCATLPSPGQPATLVEAEAAHATRVLRLGDGDEIEALDGSGKAVLAVLRVRGSVVKLEYVGVTRIAEAPATALHLEASILKGDAMEWVVEKALELGVTALTPIVAAHTVVQIKDKGPHAFRQRWQRIADQALKQCGRLDRLEIAMPIALAEALALAPPSPASPRLWCDESGREQTPELGALVRTASWDSVRILVGPEGGWSAAERELLQADGRLHGGSATIRASLGPLVLRAETAAIFAVSVVSAGMRAVPRTVKADKPA